MLQDEQEINNLFWDENPQWLDREGNITEKKTSHTGANRVYKTDIRLAYCDFIENLVRSGQITEEIAREVTLKEL